MSNILWFQDLDQDLEPLKKENNNNNNDKNAQK